MDSDGTCTGRATLLFADDFETGDLNRWSERVIDGGDLRISAAALIGAYGLEAVINDNRALYVEMVLPNIVLPTQLLTSRRLSASGSAPLLAWTAGRVAPITLMTLCHAPQGASGRMLANSRCRLVNARIV